MADFVDLTGMRFGRLTVMHRSKPNKSYHGSMWECRCDCGNETVVNAQNLKSGNTKSCGCLHKERFTSRTHGESGTRLHRIWKAIHTRCNNPNTSVYKYYGGRGIRVCEEWMRSFQSFRDWAISHGYEDSLSIDRIDTNGNYEPSNCRWVTMSEQNKNKRVKNGYKIMEV